MRNSEHWQRMHVSYQLRNRHFLWPICQNAWDLEKHIKKRADQNNKIVSHQQKCMNLKNIGHANLELWHTHDVGWTKSDTNNVYAEIANVRQASEWKNLHDVAKLSEINGSHKKNPRNHSLYDWQTNETSTRITKIHDAPTRCLQFKNYQIHKMCDWWPPEQTNMKFV